MNICSDLDVDQILIIYGSLSKQKGSNHNKLLAFLTLHIGTIL